MRSHLSRRTFIRGIGAAGLVGGLGVWRPQVWAMTSPGQPHVLTGNDFDLSIAETPINITGSERTATLINGTLPGPVLRWKEGDVVTLRVANRMSAQTSIHWHGILVPTNMDGVPGLSFGGIDPGETYTYRFKVKQHGTYWYHSHSGMQEQTGVYGPLVIEPKDPEPFKYDRDYVVMLSDWTDEDPRRIKAKLKKQSNYYNFHQRTFGDFIRDVKKDGLGATIADRKMWAEMRMSPTDLGDVSAYTYTYLVNGLAPNGNWTGIFRPGERIRLRFINASAMTYFDVRIPGLKMTVVAADGQPVKPVSVEEFRIAVAETYDVIVEPTSEAAYTIFAQSMDRTGFARATLAVREGLSAKIPPLDPRPLVTMDDMGMGGMAGMDHDSMQGMAGMSSMSGDSMQGMSGMAGMDHGSMQGMDGMSSMSGDSMQGMSGMAGMDHGSMQGMEGMEGMSSMSGDSMQGMSGMAGMDHGSMQGMGSMQSHPATENGNPLVDGQAMNPTPKLNDPGIGLRNNGRRVLTYADLRSTFADPDGRDPTRTIELHLTGHMEKFVWSFNGVKFGDSQPIRLKYGERVRLVLVNDTMMTHPIHLHGMWSDLEDEQGRFMVRKHTIDIAPGSKRSYRVTADALGRWAYHCHLLFHMETGMFREVVVEE
ncbi:MULTISPECIES: copper resistance system multicopper oxidase [Pandoraea]|uniref:Copper oxidase n=3 Tax=Pandoraea TaxID=93217 RepID=A0A5E5PAC2_9BURK|nr:MULTISPECIES: copper resistance system multicopper oxidase [Pandoraea]MBN9094649.1 copper resistance system multicopper oxidase [Pandoraea pnomenusa]OXS88468.1 copper oxidase [Pandoraea apista]RRJ28832.1 copper resistance system multicopper oxidase [Pandoraea apista]RRJ73760.1 copper resistance system multicopper oxidase [Pandoraea apista]RSD07638.1 copper resistance system multicopper oxidase [Pandoraea apista]